MDSRASLVNAADSGRVFVTWGSRAVIVQDCCGTVCDWLARGSHDHHGGALLYVGGVIFLVADVVWLLAGKIADFGLRESATGAE